MSTTTATTVVIDPQKRDPKNKLNLNAIRKHDNIISTQVLLWACATELTAAALSTIILYIKIKYSNVKLLLKYAQQRTKRPRMTSMGNREVCSAAGKKKKKKTVNFSK